MQKPTQKQQELISHFGAKLAEEAKPGDWLASFTERGDMFILTPRSKVFKTRRVLAQLAGA